MFKLYFLVQLSNVSASVNVSDTQRGDAAFVDNVLMETRSESDNIQL